MKKPPTMQTRWLNLVEPDTRRRTLIAQRAMSEGAVVYTFDVYLQGERETVFFDV